MKFEVSSCGRRLADAPRHPLQARRRGKNFRAYTLIELMIVVAIIGLIAAMGVPALNRMLIKEGMRKAGPVLLEPVMRVEVLTPEDYMGDIIGDLSSRRGQISGMDQRGAARSIDAMAPLANMFGYVNQLRSFSQGRANYTMQFDHYEQVPPGEAAKVQAKFA